MFVCQSYPKVSPTSENRGRISTCLMQTQNFVSSSFYLLLTLCSNSKKSMQIDLGFWGFAGAATGTVEPRSIADPVRRIVQGVGFCRAHDRLAPLKMQIQIDSASSHTHPRSKGSPYPQFLQSSKALLSRFVYRHSKCKGLKLRGAHRACVTTVRAVSWRLKPGTLTSTRRG